MAKKGFLLSEEMVDAIRQILDEWDRRNVSPRRRITVQSEGQTPDVYVAATPLSGIPALTDPSGTGGGSLPGSAECDIYRSTIQGGLAELTPVFNLSQTVYNLSAVAIPGDTWALVARDKFGEWYVTSLYSETDVEDPFSLTVNEVDGAPYYSGVNTIQFDQADGFVLSQPGVNIVRVDQTPASGTEVGYVTVTTQIFAGTKTFNGEVNVVGRIALANGSNLLPLVVMGSVTVVGSTTTVVPNWAIYSTSGISPYPSWPTIGVYNDPAGSAVIDVEYIFSPARFYVPQDVIITYPDATEGYSGDYGILQVVGGIVRGIGGSGVIDGGDVDIQNEDLPDPLLLGDGTVGAPTYSFASDPDTGIYRYGADSIAATVGGTLAWVSESVSGLATRFGVGCDPVVTLDILGLVSAGNAVSNAMRFSLHAVDAVVAGFGLGINLTLENAAGSDVQAGNFRVVWTDASAGTADMRWLVATGGTVTEYMRLNSTGLIIGNILAPGAKLHVRSTDAAIIGCLIRGATSQSVSLQEWHNVSNTVLLAVQSTGHLAFGEGINIVAGATTGTKVGTGATQKLGFWGVTPVVQPSAYTQTYSTADKTHAAFTSADIGAFTGGLVGFLDAAERDNIRTQVNALRADLADLKQLVNSVIDDLQAIGVLS